MTPERFLQKLVDVVGMVKAPLVIIICAVSIIQVVSTTFVSGNDKRAILLLLGVAALLFYIDRLILWLAGFFGR